MNVYLYTEDFHSLTYRVYRWDGEHLNALSDGENQKMLSVASKCECRSEVLKDGISIGGSFGVKTYLAFNLVVNERSPSGRKRAIFGFTDSSVLPIEISSDFIRNAIANFCLQTGVSVPDDRVELLISRLNEENKMLQAHATKRDINILCACVTLGISAFLVWIKKRLHNKKEDGYVGKN